MPEATARTFKSDSEAIRRGGRTIAYPRGTVVWGRDPFRPGSNWRLWLVLSTDDHPFHGEEYCCALLTTTGRENAVRLADVDWVRGRAPRETHVSPWVPMTVKAVDVRDRQGRLATPLVDRIAREVASYVAGGSAARPVQSPPNSAPRRTEPRPERLRQD